MKREAEEMVVVALHHMAGLQGHDPFHIVGGEN